MTWKPVKSDSRLIISSLYSKRPKVLGFMFLIKNLPCSISFPGSSKVLLTLIGPEKIMFNVSERIWFHESKIIQKSPEPPRGVQSSYILIIFMQQTNAQLIWTFLLQNHSIYTKSCNHVALIITNALYPLFKKKTFIKTKRSLTASYTF